MSFLLPSDSIQSQRYLPGVQEACPITNQLVLLIERIQVISHLHWREWMLKTPICSPMWLNLQACSNLGPHREMHEVKIHIIQIEIAERLLTGSSHQ